MSTIPDMTKIQSLDLIRNIRLLKEHPEKSAETDTDIDTSSETLWQRIKSWREARLKIKEERRRRKGPLREWIELIVSIIVIVFFIRLVVVEAFRIPTGSMEDTLLVGDFLLVNKFIYGVRSPDWIGVPYTRLGFFIPFFRLPGIREPRPGDIVVFRFPLDPNLSYIKRCVAVEGQTVEIREKKLYQRF